MPSPKWSPTGDGAGRIGDLLRQTRQDAFAVVGADVAAVLQRYGKTLELAAVG
jgi:hypothetical protein